MSIVSFIYFSAISAADYPFAYIVYSLGFDFDDETAVDKLGADSRSEPPKVFPLPLKAVNEDVLVSSLGRVAPPLGLCVAVLLELPPPMKLFIIPPPLLA